MKQIEYRNSGNCASCVFWFPTEMRCKRYPPVLNLISALKGESPWQFPKVNGLEVCGEFTDETN